MRLIANAMSAGSGFVRAFSIAITLRHAASASTGFPLLSIASAAARAMQEQAGELSRQVGFFHLSEDGDDVDAAAVQARTQKVAVATEAVFAAMRNAPASKTSPATADAGNASGAWKEF